MADGADQASAADIAARVEAFIRDVVVSFEHDSRWGSHGPSSELVRELRTRAAAAGVLTPHVRPDGSHLDHRSTALVLRAAGLSPLGPTAVNVGAPDEGNMYLLGKIGTPEQKEKFLAPLLSGQARSAFLMTEPAADGGAGSDPAMMQTAARREGSDWRITGRKAFVTGAEGAAFGIVMAKTEAAATMFLVDLPDPSVVLERVLDTIDSSYLPSHGSAGWVALGTIEKNHPESGFEVTNEFADYRLRTLEPACASREAALIDRSDEGPQLVQRDAVQHDFPSVYRINRWIVSKYNGYSQGTAARTIRLIPAVTNEVANDHATTAHRFQRFGR